MKLMTLYLIQSKKYPKSFLRNDTIFFNIDTEKLTNQKSINAFNSIIYFSPQFSQFEHYAEIVGREFSAPAINIQIYSQYHPDFLDGEVFYADYDVTNPNALNRLGELNFEINNCGQQNIITIEKLVFNTKIKRLFQSGLMFIFCSCFK